jgi:hypothetical protein
MSDEGQRVEPAGLPQSAALKFHSLLLIGLVHGRGYIRNEPMSLPLNCSSQGSALIDSVVFVSVTISKIRAGALERIFFGLILRTALAQAATQRPI